MSQTEVPSASLWRDVAAFNAIATPYMTATIAWSMATKESLAISMLITAWVFGGCAGAAIFVSALEPPLPPTDWVKIFNRIGLVCIWLWAVYGISKLPGVSSLGVAAFYVFGASIVIGVLVIATTIIRADDAPNEETE